MIEETRRIVALCAGHVTMAGDFPRVNISIHLVTEAAECRRFRKLEKGHGDDEKGDHAEDQEDFNSFDVFLGPSFRLMKEIDPEILYQTIKVLKRFHGSPHFVDRGEGTVDRGKNFF
jgi:hypothetical protein